MPGHEPLDAIQAHRIHDHLRPTGAFLHTLLSGRSEFGSSPADDVFRAVIFADRALEELLLRTRGLAHSGTLEAARGPENKMSKRPN